MKLDPVMVEGMKAPLHQHGAYSVHTRKLFGTPWFVFREEAHKPDGIAAALFL